MNASLRTRWTAVVVLASLYVGFNVSSSASASEAGRRSSGCRSDFAVVAYGVARLLGWEGIDR